MSIRPLAITPIPGPRAMPLVGWRGNLLRFGADPLGYVRRLHRGYGELDAEVRGVGVCDRNLEHGFTAAIELARAGRSVLLIERESTVGGGMRTAELTLSGAPSVRTTTDIASCGR